MRIAARMNKRAGAELLYRCVRTHAEQSRQSPNGLFVHGRRFQSIDARWGAGRGDEFYVYFDFSHEVLSNVLFPIFPGEPAGAS